MGIVRINGEMIEIDDICVDIIESLNRYGFTTQFCCQGHSPYEDFSIIFDRSVTDGMIYELAKAYESTNDYMDPNNYPMYPFNKWVRYQRILKDDGTYDGFVLMENWQIIIQAFCFGGNETRRQILVEDLTRKMKLALESLNLIQLKDISFDDCCSEKE